MEYLRWFGEGTITYHPPGNSNLNWPTELKKHWRNMSLSTTDRFFLFVLKTAGGKIQKQDLVNTTELSDDTIRQAANRLIFNNRIRKIHELVPGQGVRVFYEVIV